MKSAYHFGLANFHDRQAFDMPQVNPGRDHQFSPTLVFSHGRSPTSNHRVYSVVSQLNAPIIYLVGGIPTPLKNDGVHQLG